MDKMTKKEMLLTALFAPNDKDENDIIDGLKAIYLYLADSIIFSSKDDRLELGDDEWIGMCILRSMISILKE